MFLNPVDRLGNIHGLSHNWMALNVEASLCSLGVRDRRGEEDDGRSLHSGIGLDLCGYVASVSLWHHDVEQDEIGPEIPRTLIRLRGVVLFEYTVPADLLEKDFDQVGTVPLVINNQDTSLFFHRRPCKSFVRPAFLRR